MHWLAITNLCYYPDIIKRLSDLPYAGVFKPIRQNSGQVCRFRLQTRPEEEFLIWHLENMCSRLLVAMAGWGSAFTDKYFLSGEQNIFARFTPRLLQSSLSALANNWLCRFFFFLYFFGNGQDLKDRLWPSGTLLGSFWGIKLWHEAKTRCQKHNIPRTPKNFSQILKALNNDR